MNLALSVWASRHCVCLFIFCSIAALTILHIYHPPINLTHDKFIRYNCHYGRLGNHVLSFTYALTLAQTNGRKLLIEDKLLTTFINLSPFASDITFSLPTINSTDMRFFRNENDMKHNKRFDKFTLHSDATMIDIGIAYDFTSHPVPPDILRNITLHSFFINMATRFLQDHHLHPKDYACLHHRGTDFSKTPNFVPLHVSASSLLKEAPRIRTLFVSTDENPDVIKDTLQKLLPDHTLLFIYNDPMQTIVIDGQPWNAYAIGTSLHVCAMASHTILNPASTFSNLIHILSL